MADPIINNQNVPQNTDLNVERTDILAVAEPKIHDGLSGDSYESDPYVALDICTFPSFEQKDNSGQFDAHRMTDGVVAVLDCSIVKNLAKDRSKPGGWNTYTFKILHPLTPVVATQLLADYSEKLETLSSSEMQGNPKSVLTQLENIVERGEYRSSSPYYQGAVSELEYKLHELSQNSEHYESLVVPIFKPELHDLTERYELDSFWDELENQIRNIDELDLNSSTVKQLILKLDLALKQDVGDTKSKIDHNTAVHIESAIDDTLWIVRRSSENFLEGKISIFLKAVSRAYGGHVDLAKIGTRDYYSSLNPFVRFEAPDIPLSSAFSFSRLKSLAIEIDGVQGVSKLEENWQAVSQFYRAFYFCLFEPKEEKSEVAIQSSWGDLGAIELALMFYDSVKSYCMAIYIEAPGNDYVLSPEMLDENFEYLRRRLVLRENEVRAENSLNQFVLSCVREEKQNKGLYIYPDTPKLNRSSKTYKLTPIQSQELSLAWSRLRMNEGVYETSSHQYYVENLMSQLDTAFFIKGDLASSDISSLGYEFSIKGFETALGKTLETWTSSTESNVQAVSSEICLALYGSECSGKKLDVETHRTDSEDSIVDYQIDADSLSLIIRDDTNFQRIIHLNWTSQLKVYNQVWAKLRLFHQWADLLLSDAHLTKQEKQNIKSVRELFRHLLTIHENSKRE